MKLKLKKNNLIHIYVYILYIFIYKIYILNLFYTNHFPFFLVPFFGSTFYWFFKNSLRSFMPVTSSIKIFKIQNK